MTFGTQEAAAFLAIYQHRSIGRAASQLGMTQPGLSRILRKLEGQLGNALFQRHPTGVLPTAAAEVFKRYAEEIVSNAKTAIEELAALSGRGILTVRVGTTASIANTLLPQAIKRLLQKFPTMRIQIIEGIEDVLSEALAQAQIDIAIAARMEQNAVPLSKPEPLSTTLVVMANSSHELVQMPRVTLLELTKCRWVLPPQFTMVTTEFHQIFRKAGLEPPSATVETRSNNVMRSLVSMTDLLAWQPRILLSLRDPDHPIAEINAPELVWKRQFFIFKRRQGILNLAAMRLVDELRAICHDE